MTVLDDEPIDWDTVTANLGLVYFFAHRCQARHFGEDLDDIVQDGVLGLCRAVQKYDAGLGFAFSTYAGIWIRQYQQRGIHKRSYGDSRGRGPLVVSLDAQLEGVDDDTAYSYSILSQLAAGDDTEADALGAVAVADAIDGLTPEELDLLTGTLRETAARLGLSAEWVRRKRIRAREAHPELREALAS